MLDQNTDRMWYVIGAVLVGAAIILIANSTFPEIFASVTNSMAGTVDNVATEIDRLDTSNVIINGNKGNWVLWQGTVSRDNVMVSNIKDENNEWIVRLDYDSFVPGDRMAAMQPHSSNMPELEIGKKYIIKFDVRGDIDKLSYSYILNGKGVVHNQPLSMSHYSEFDEIEYKTITHEFTYGDYPETGARILLGSMPEDARWIEFKNIYLLDVK